MPSTSSTRRSWPTALLATLILFGGLLLPDRTSAQAAKASSNKPVVEVDDSFVSQKIPIRVMRFETKGNSRQPAIIILHGCDGWEQLPAYRFAAQALVKEGYVVILIRYFDRTSTSDQETPAQRAEFLRWLDARAIHEKENAARTHFANWVATVGDALEYARRLPNVDPQRVGVAGFSLGGYLAVAAATEKPFRIDAVVEMFGGLPEEYRGRVRSMPPLLILHGEEDTIVSVKEAHALNGLLAHKKQNVELKLYPGVGHAFLPPGKDQPNMLIVMDAKSRMTNFFKRQLAAANASAVVEK